MDSPRLVVVGLPTLIHRCLSTTFKSGQRCNFRIVLIMPRITFSHRKQSMPFPRPSEAWTSGRCDVVPINTDNKVWFHSGLEGVSSSCMPVSSTDFPTRFQGIISPICVLFFVPSHPEEPEILLVQIYFSCLLSVSILYPSCLELANDNRTRRVRIQGHQLGCIF